MSDQQDMDAASPLPLPGHQREGESGSDGSSRLMHELRECLDWVSAIAVFCVFFGYLGRFFWFADLFSHFRFHYSLLLLVIFPAYLYFRRYGRAAVAILVLILNSLSFAHFYIAERSVWDSGVKTGKPIYSLMLINVNSSGGDPTRVLAYINEIKPDIVVLEEISDRWQAALSELQADYPFTHLEPRNDNFGIGIYSQFELVDARTQFIGGRVPSVTCKVKLAEHQLGLLATHPLPPIGGRNTKLRNQQLYELPEHVDASRPFILVGDLNIAPWNYHYREMKGRAGLMDSLSGYGLQTSWPSSLPIKIPIDHLLHSPSVWIVNRHIGGHVGSDHYPLYVRFVLADEIDEGAKQDE